MVDRWCCALLTVAGVLGAAGVALGAASAHLGGGDLARLGAFFLLIHAAAIPAILAAPGVSPRLRRVAGTLLGVGAASFSGDLAYLAFRGVTPIAGLAPLGGLLLIAGWLVYAFGGVLAFARGRSAAT